MQRTATIWFRLAALSWLLVATVSASAHAPYANHVATLKPSDNVELKLYKSYIDGIFFTDPVKLEVRDPSDFILLETDFGRDIVLFCPDVARCVVFRYDGSFPLVPEDIWWLRGPKLEKTESFGLTALGVMVPLWEHRLGYFVALGLFFLPYIVFRRFTIPSSGILRLFAQVTTAVLSVFFLLLWLYAVVALSYLSLPLLAALIAVAIAFSCWFRRRGLISASSGCPQAD